MCCRVTDNIHDVFVQYILLFWRLVFIQLVYLEHYGSLNRRGKGEQNILVQEGIINCNGSHTLLILRNGGFNQRCYKPMFTLKFTISLHDGNKML